MSTAAGTVEPVVLATAELAAGSVAPAVGGAGAVQGACVVEACGDLGERFASEHAGHVHGNRDDAAVLGSNTVPILISVWGASPHPYAQEVALSPRVVSASEWVPARKELQATEEEAVRALWQIADDTGR